jgi:hypothetical protein
MTEQIKSPEQYEWFYLEGKAQVGPVSAKEIRRLHTQGLIPANVLVWRNGLGEWKPLSSVVELLDMPLPVPEGKPSAPNVKTETVNCPHCGGEIKAAAKLCKHCKQAVNEASSPSIPTDVYAIRIQETKSVIFTIALLIQKGLCSKQDIDPFRSQHPTNPTALLNELVKTGKITPSQVEIVQSAIKSDLLSQARSQGTFAVDSLIITGPQFDTIISGMQDVPMPESFTDLLLGKQLITLSQKEKIEQLASHAEFPPGDIATNAQTRFGNVTESSIDKKKQKSPVVRNTVLQNIPITSIVATALAGIGLLLAMLPVVGFVGIVLGTASLVTWLATGRTKTSLSKVGAILAVCCMVLGAMSQAAYIANDYIQSENIEHRQFENSKTSYENLIGAIRVYNNGHGPYSAEQIFQYAQEAIAAYSPEAVESIFGNKAQSAKTTISEYLTQTEGYYARIEGGNNTITSLTEQKTIKCKRGQVAFGNRFDETADGRAFYEAMVVSEKSVVIIKESDFPNGIRALSFYTMCLEYLGEKEYTQNMVNTVTGAQWTKKTFNKTYEATKAYSEDYYQEQIVKTTADRDAALQLLKEATGKFCDNWNFPVIEK